MGDQRLLVTAADIPADRRRGAELRVLLGPRTVGSTSGFLGVADLAPGERIAEHYHPYSEEFLYVCRGEIVVDLDDEPVAVPAGSALFIPVRVRHRLRNVGTAPAEVVFHLAPLAPRPELGHVDTEPAEGAAAAGQPATSAPTAAMTATPAVTPTAAAVTAAKPVSTRVPMTPDPPAAGLASGGAQQSPRQDGPASPPTPGGRLPTERAPTEMAS